MLNWRADFLLAMNTNLQCTDRICLNYGTCLNFGAFKSINEIVEICFCADGFFGPNCEYISDDLLLIILSEDTLGVNDDGDKSRKRSHIGKSRRRGRGGKPWTRQSKKRTRAWEAKLKKYWKNRQNYINILFNNILHNYFFISYPRIRPPLDFQLFKIFSRSKTSPAVSPRSQLVCRSIFETIHRQHIFKINVTRSPFSSLLSSTLWWKAWLLNS